MKLYKVFIKIYKQLIFFYAPNIIVLIHKKLINIKKTPIVNQKLYLTGKGRIIIGKNNRFGFKLGGFNKYGTIEIQARSKKSIILLGDNISTNNNVFICANNNIEIKNNVLIGQNVTLIDFEPHGIKPNERRGNVINGKITICENVYIGSNVTILKNTTIGANSIIATGSVVSGIFPPNVLLGGVPAKIIKNI